MSESLGTPESVPTVGAAIEEVFLDPYTRTTVRDTRILVSGEVIVTRYLNLDGWPDLTDIIDPQKTNGGTLTLYHDHAETYGLFGRPGNPTDRYGIAYSYCPDAEGRITATVFSDAIDPRLPLNYDDRAPRLLAAHMAHRYERYRPKLPEHEEPYKLTYNPDISIPPDVYTNNPGVYINQQIKRLQMAADPDSEHEERLPEIVASNILAPIHQGLTRGYKLEGFGITKKELDDLVRQSYLQSARHMLQRARAGECREWEFTERVGEWLWRAGRQPADIGTTESEIFELDLLITAANVSATLKNLRATTLTTRDPSALALKMIQERVDLQRKQIWEFSMRMGVSVGDLCKAHGLSMEEYEQIHASYKPKGLRRVARSLGSLLQN